MICCDYCGGTSGACVCPSMLDTLSEIEAYRHLIKHWATQDGSCDIDRDILEDLQKIYERGHNAKIRKE